MRQTKIGVSTALVTPMKNERENVENLVKAISQQKYYFDLWLVIDDNSSDGCGDLLRSQAVICKNVKKILVERIEHLPKEYGLGFKYASIILFGIDFIKKIETEQGRQFDFLGILDADCFPYKDYYANLMDKFGKLPNLGIASGMLDLRNGQEISVRYKNPRRFPIGGIRIWKRACLEAAPYQSGYSADAISTAKAWSKGWCTQSFADAKAITRFLGSKTNPEYYGDSAYKRYIPLYMVVARVVLYTVLGHGHQVRGFLRGYLNARKVGQRMELEPYLVNYYRMLPLRIIIENIIVLRNELVLFIKRKHHIALNTIQNETDS